jgi:hypothetical protein
VSFERGARSKSRTTPRKCSRQRRLFGNQLPDRIAPDSGAIMQTQFHYQLTRDEYVVGLGALMNELARQDMSGMRRLLEQLAMCVLVLAVITIAFPDALTGLLVATVLLAVLLGAMQARWLRAATGQSFDPAVADHEVEISDEGIIASSSLRVRRWSWRSVRRIHDLKQAIVLEFAGWDMLILPNRLWGRSEARGALLDEIRRLATHAAPSDAPRPTTTFQTRDLIIIGALAAAVDVLALVVFAMPAHRGPNPPISDPMFVGTFAAIMLLGLALAYAAFRISRSVLARLHDRSPRVAVVIAQALIWAVPAYILIAYFGWI